MRGYTVYTATMREDALVSISQDEPDLILLDIRLDSHSDRYDGMDVLREAKKIRPSAKVIMTTAVENVLWVAGVRENSVGLNYYPYPGPLYAVYFLMYCAVFGFAEIVVFLASRRLKGREGKQAFWVHRFPLPNPCLFC